MDKKPFFKSLGNNVISAGFVSMLMDISSEMVYPLLPLFLTSVLGASKTTVGLIEGIAEATASILKVFSGWLSDRLGRRKLLMGVGYGISAISRPFMAGAASWFAVLTARFIDRVGKGIRGAPRDALIAESTDRERLGAAFGFHRTMDTMGAVIGPVAASIILLYYAGNLRLVFYLATIPGILAVLAVIFFIKEKARDARVARPAPKLSVAGFGFRFKAFLAVMAIFSIATFADSFLILKAKELDISDAVIPIIYLAYNIIYALTATPMGLLADRIGHRTVVLAGFFIFAAIFGAFTLAQTHLHIWALFLLFGVYKGMSDGTQRAYLAACAPVEKKATAFGIYNTVTGLMLLPASILAGYLWDTIGSHAAFGAAGVIAVIAAIAFTVTGLIERRYKNEVI